MNNSDWLGEFDYNVAAKTKQERKKLGRQIYQAFLKHESNIFKELAEQFPGINFDFSEQSLKLLDDWARDFVPRYAAVRRQDIPWIKEDEVPRDVSQPRPPLTIFNGFPPGLRGLLLNICIYELYCMNKAYPNSRIEPCSGVGTQWRYTGMPTIFEPSIGFQCFWGVSGYLLANFLSLIHPEERRDYDSLVGLHQAALEPVCIS